MPNYFLNDLILLDTANKHSFYTRDIKEAYLVFCIKCNCDF